MNLVIVLVTVGVITIAVSWLVWINWHPALGSVPLTNARRAQFYADATRHATEDPGTSRQEGR